MNLNDSLENYDQAIGTNKNYCIPLHLYFKEHVDTFSVQLIFGVLYSTILVFGFVANSVTLYCLLKKSHQIDLNVKFLINLNLSGLLICITSLPITAVQIFYRQWLWGLPMCRIVPLLQGTSFFINSFTLVAIAVDRYLIIIKDANQRNSLWDIIILVFIWILGVVVAVPYALYMDLAKSCSPVNPSLCLCGEFCEETWPNQWMKTGYGSCCFFVQFGLPLCILAACYWRVQRTVAIGVEKRLSKERLTLLGRQRLIDRKKRTATTTVLLVLSFIASWLPVNILNLLRDYDCVLDDYVAIVFAICHLIAMTSILWNPVIYCWYNKQLFTKFVHLFECK